MAVRGRGGAGKKTVVGALLYKVSPGFEALSLDISGFHSDGY